MRSASPWRMRGWSSTTRTVFLAVCTGLSRTRFVVICFFLRASGGHGEHAGNACSVGRAGADVQPAADHPRSITHDVQPHPTTGRPVFLKSGAVVVDVQGSPAIFGKQTDEDIARVVMFNGVIHG